MRARACVCVRVCVCVSGEYLCACVCVVCMYLHGMCGMCGVVWYGMIRYAWYVCVLSVMYAYVYGVHVCKCGMHACVLCMYVCMYVYMYVCIYIYISDVYAYARARVVLPKTVVKCVRGEGRNTYHQIYTLALTTHTMHIYISHIQCIHGARASSLAKNSG